MTQQNSDFWEKAVDARKELLEQYAEDPNVALIDIGYLPEDAENADEIGLRIHVTEEWCETPPEGRTDFETEVHGIPVYIVCDDD